MYKPILLIPLMSVLYGSTLFAAAPNNEDVAKRIYEGSDVPTYLVFKSILRQVSSLHAQNREFAYSHVGYYLGPIKDPELISSTLEIFLELEKSMSAEILDTEVSVLCPESKATWSKDKTYRALDSLDDARYAIFQKYFVIASNRMDSDAFDGLLHAIEETKDSFISVRIDNKKFYEQAGEDVILASDVMCSSLLERQLVENQ